MNYFLYYGFVSYYFLKYLSNHFMIVYYHFMMIISKDLNQKKTINDYC